MIGPEAVPLATGGFFRVARSRGTPHAVSSRTVQSHPGAVVPRLPVIPKLDAFDCMRLAGEAHDAVSSSWPDTVANGQFLRRSISEVDNDTVEENGITTHPQLNSVKDTIATRDLDPVMIPSASICASPKKSQTCPRPDRQMVLAKPRRQTNLHARLLLGITSPENLDIRPICYRRSRRLTTLLTPGFAQL